MESTPTLVIRLFHKVMFGATDIPLGKIELPLERMLKSELPNYDEWYPLELDGRMRETAGEVCSELTTRTQI